MVETFGHDAVEHEDGADTGVPATDHPGETALIEQIPRRLFVPESRPRYPRSADVLLHNVPRRVSSLEIGSLEDVAATCVVSLYPVGAGDGIVVAIGRWGFPSNPAEGHSLRSPIKDVSPVVQKMTANAWEVHVSLASTSVVRFPAPQPEPAEPNYEVRVACCSRQRSVPPVIKE